MKKFTFIALLATMLCGCAQFADEELNTQKIVAPESIEASFEEPSSRTYVENDKYLRWTAGDEISYFPGVTFNMEYRFTGVTGANNGSFSKVTVGPVTGNELSRNYAIYPYDEDIAVSDEGVISLNLPAVQKYAVNSFGVGANTMVAATNGTNDEVLKFRNVGGYLKIKLYGDDVTVKSVKLQGNNNEKIAGPALITATYGNDPTVVMTAEATTSVTIDCGEGVTISDNSETPTEFWFVLPTVTFEDGFTITVTDVNDGTFVKSTSNTFTIDRNMIQPMKELNAVIEGGSSPDPEPEPEPDPEPEPEPEPVGPANNEIWYKSVDNNIRIPYNRTGFGANYKTNEYDTESGYWIITFDGDVTTVPSSAFSNNNGSFGITEILLPSTLTTIKSGAFSYCLELSSVLIPANVSTIEDRPFTSCSGIKAFYGKYASSDNRCLIKDGAIISFATYGIEQYTTPPEANAIGKYAFYGATIKTLTVTENIKMIANDAFSTSLLEYVELPSSITTIPSGAFSNCYKLEYCNIPIGISSIGEVAFKNCSKLKTITLPSTVTSIGTNAFKDSKIETLNILCNIPDNKSSYGTDAYFYSATIGHAIIGKQVTAIGKLAFGNSNIQKITIGEMVSSLGKYAFSDCKQLTEIYCRALTPPFAEESFSNLATLNKIYVPASDDDSIINAYKAADGWKKYADAIEEYEFE